jgi:hypothetical protein
LDAPYREAQRVCNLTKQEEWHLSGMCIQDEISEPIMEIKRTGRALIFEKKMLSMRYTKWGAEP